MCKTNQYSPTDKMSDLICDNYALLQVMSRFDLPLGFGDRTVEEVCKANHVDCSTFLTVVNFITEESGHVCDNVKNLSVRSLMNYLKQAHHYFLDFQLPGIRRKLTEALDCSAEKDLSFLILKFFDAYADEVRKHMDNEDQNVFTYVERLLDGHREEGFRISMFARNHDQVDAKLTELKNIIIKYYPSKQTNYRMNAVLFDIFSCEEDLASHCRVEDFLFVPAVWKLEKEAE